MLRAPAYSRRLRRLLLQEQIKLNLESPHYTRAWLVVNRGRFFNMALSCCTQIQKEWTQDRTLMDTTREWKGLRKVAWGLNWAAETYHRQRRCTICMSGVIIELIVDKGGKCGIWCGVRQRSQGDRGRRLAGIVSVDRYLVKLNWVGWWRYELEERSSLTLSRVRTILLKSNEIKF